MTNEAMIEVLLKYLAKNDLVICKTSSGFPLAALDGFQEREAVTGIVELLDDTFNVVEWEDEDTTAPVHKGVLAALARAS